MEILLCVVDPEHAIGIRAASAADVESDEVAVVARDEVDQAHVGEVAVHARARSADHLDALELLDRHEQDGAALERRFARDRQAVDEHFDVAGIEEEVDAAHADRRRAEAVALDVESRHEGDAIERGARAEQSQLVGLQHADRAGHVIGVLLGLRGQFGFLLQ